MQTGLRRLSGAVDVGASARVVCMAIYPELSGQRALVTGGGAGIGAAVVRLLAANGAAIAILEANPTAAEILRAEVEQAGGRALAFAADAASAPAWPPVVVALEQTWGGIDLLVNAAGGIWRQRRLGEIDEAEWDAVLAANLKSTFLACQAVLPGMQSRGHGRIVNVASDVARAPLGITGAHYVAAKSGVLGLTRHLAREVAGEGIRVNAIAPAVTLTPRIAQLYDPATQEALASGVPLGRLARAEEPASAVLFLLSDAASYVTGACLDVTGGRVMT